jgi:hypothetical protein
MNVWEIAILKSIDYRGGEADTQQIYTDMESGTFISLNGNDLRTTKYGDRPAYQHQVRSHLSNLTQSKNIQKVSRGVYSITAKGMRRIRQ